jgi:uncharacterized protein (DUF362 family)
MSYQSSPTVSLQRVESYDLHILRQGLQDCLAPWGGLSAFLPQGSDATAKPRVLLKPNLLTGSRPQNECTTRPEVVQVVAEAVIAAGGAPFVGDSPAFGSARGVAEKNGLLPICEALAIPIVEFQGQRYATQGETFDHLRLSREAMQADVVINLPKVKSHAQLRVTLGVKNLFGCVPGKLKAWWHMEAGKDPMRFGKMLVETAMAIDPQLTIADGIIGHEGNGPSGGTPRPLGVLAASPNVFALERVLLAILQVDPQEVPIYCAAQALAVMPELEDLEIVGLDWPSLSVSDWKLPDRMVPIDFGAPRVIRSTVKHLLTLWQEVV